MNKIMVIVTVLGLGVLGAAVTGLLPGWVGILGLCVAGLALFGLFVKHEKSKVIVRDRMAPLEREKAVLTKKDLEKMREELKRALEAEDEKARRMDSPSVDDVATELERLRNRNKSR